MPARHVGTSELGVAASLLREPLRYGRQAFDDQIVAGGKQLLPFRGSKTGNTPEDG
jgi:hypothetical protein